jgi:sugar lactone lactonase YvrE
MLTFLLAVSLQAATPPVATPTGHGAERMPRQFRRMPEPTAGKEGLELIAEPQVTPGNAAITPEGRLFLSMHPFGDPKWRVAEVVSTGALRPYPTEAWSRPVGPDGVGLQWIIGIRSDKQGLLWMLDGGSLGQEGGTPPKLVAWDTRGERLDHVFHLPPPVTKPSSFLQDFAIDEKRDAIYIADCGIGAGFERPTPAIVVLYRKTGMARRVLEGAACVMGEPDAAMVIDGTEVTVKGSDGKPMAPRIGINPIVIDAAEEWVYFGSMHGTTVWKVKADDLANPALGDDELAKRVVRHGPKGVSDGMAIDPAGTIYVTEVTKNAIGALAQDGSYRLLPGDPAWLSWPDSITPGPDGAMYVVVNQLHRHGGMRAAQGGEDVTQLPFRVVRFQPIPAQ